MPFASKLTLGRRSGAELIGLDIQPGFVAAVQAGVNGTIMARRAAVLPLAADVVREGEVADVQALSDALRELFSGSGMSKRVRVGVANQRTVMRMLDLPPVTDHKDLAAAVRFQAQDQVPMPLNNAVLDFHPLGIVETPEGPRQRVVLVAAQRDAIERLLIAIQGAGLRAEGVDLSAFALIRSLHRPDEDHAGRVLYLNIDGLTNLAIAEGTVCRLTRVVGGGMEAMAAELAERRGIAVSEARVLLAGADLTAPDVEESGTATPASAAPFEQSQPTAEAAGEMAPRDRPAEEELDEIGPPISRADSADAPAPAPANGPAGEPAGEADQSASESAETDLHAREAELSYSESVAANAVAASPAEEPPTQADVRTVLENGIREISGEVRNSLEFHRTREEGGIVSHVALSGSALDIPGFAEAFRVALGVDVHAETVALSDERLADSVPVHRLAVATGLAAVEVPR